MSTSVLNWPRFCNATAAPSASPTARPSRLPRKRSTGRKRVGKVMWGIVCIFALCREKRRGTSGGFQMRVVAMLDHKLHLRDIPVPTPGPGEVLVRTLACGICGSDLHALKHTEKMIESSRRSGGGFVMDPKRDVVMGHEFCAEIVDHGPGSPKTLKAGTRVCAMPILVSAQGVATVGYSNESPGGYGEFMRLMEPLLLPVPNGLSTEHAALTEPMAVGLH